MPFIIKKNNKKTRIVAGGKPTYKKHRDDEDNKGIPESESGSGSGSESEGEHSSTSSVSISVPERRRNTRAMTVTKKNKDPSRECGGWKNR
jgi:hypothetical protein